MVNANFPYQNIVQKTEERYLFSFYGNDEEEIIANKSKSTTKRYKNNCLLERKTASILSALLLKIKAGNKIILVSGYRSIAEQTQLYQQSIIENGEAFTKRFVAKPKHSEHHTGLAIDLAINQNHIDFICPDFPREGIADEFRCLATEYGFIERYQKSKEKITGIAAEPWHFRYVGYPHSEIMKERNLSLEEYIEFIKGFPFSRSPLLKKKNGYQIEVSYLPINQTEILLDLPEDKDYEISGNNVDGFILTSWQKMITF